MKYIRTKDGIIAIDTFQTLIEVGEEYKDKHPNTDFQVANTIEELKNSLEVLDIIIKKYINLKDFKQVYFINNGYKWASYKEYKKAYLNYYEDDEYLLTKTEFNLIKRCVE